MPARIHISDPSSTFVKTKKDDDDNVSKTGLFMCVMSYIQGDREGKKKKYNLEKKGGYLPKLTSLTLP